MKRILVPCDFSKPAIHAYRFALSLATRSRGTLYLIFVVELPVLHDTLLMPVLSIEQDFIDDTKAKAEKDFKKLVKKYKPGSVKIKTEVIFGAVTRMIVDYAREKNVDIIVMGSHGASGIREIVVGSNAEKIVRTATVPVMVLKEYHNDQVKRIVFPYVPELDEQKDLIKQVTRLQKFFSAHLHLVWINSPALFHRDVDMQTRMRVYANRFKLKAFTAHIFNDVNEREGIINFTETVGGDLIAMGTHGRRGISHLFNGSITESLTNRVKWPVWTCVMK
ncbi:MAG: universal stress protein [Bacteroidota bacterium]